MSKSNVELLPLYLHADDIGDSVGRLTFFDPDGGLPIRSYDKHAALARDYAYTKQIVDAARERGEIA